MENWKWIEGYEGLYEVSDKGRVRTHSIYRKGEYLSLNRLNADGYLRYALRKDGKTKEFNAARLVAFHFIGEPPNEKMTINHINGIKTDNSVENLEWNTLSEQMYHAYRLGLKKPKSGCQVADKETVELIKSLYIKGKRGHSALALGKRFGISAGTVERIARGPRKRNKRCND